MLEVHEQIETQISQNILLLSILLKFKSSIFEIFFNILKIKIKQASQARLACLENFVFFPMQVSQVFNIR